MVTREVEVMNVRDKRDGRVYSCVPQMVDVNFRGIYSLCYNIGINGHHEWSNICCVYSNEEFNEHYEVVKYQKSKQAWVPALEYKFWEDE